MQKVILIAASLAGITAVILGAFGAHSLTGKIEPHELAVWEKGVQYQFYHTIALLICYMYIRQYDSKLIRNAAICFILGIICFSGSLYLLATCKLTNISPIILGPITPLGGLFFIAGWGLVFLEAVRSGNGKAPSKNGS